MADARILVQHLAEAWHSYQGKCEAATQCGQEQPGHNDADFWGVSIMQALESEGDAELMWECTMEIWRTMESNNDSRVGLFAASIVEDLIDSFGPQVIDRIESKAKEDPEFRKMLLGVWPPSDEDRPDWQRIVKLVEDLGPMQSFKDAKKT